MKRWKHRPEGSTWGDWGDDDQLGRLNLITPQKVLEGIAEVKEGLSFCLSLPLDFPGGNVLNPRRLPPVLSPTGDENGWRFNFHANTINPLFMDVASDDRVILTLCSIPPSGTPSLMSVACSTPTATVWLRRSTTMASRRDRTSSARYPMPAATVAGT